MTLQVTNTLTGEQEPFEPAEPDDVLLYYCGLTVSDPPHLGHARSWVHVDVMHRWLEYLGYGVRHVENFTDVSEKIVARVGEDGDTEAAVARHYIAESLAAMRALNLLRAEVYPRVSEHVEEIVALIQTLLEQDYAYEANGSVYFDVTRFEAYGALSNQQLDEIEAQGDPDERDEKRHPADFALWKADGVNPDTVEDHRHDAAAPPAEAAETALTFESPWGPGRPGWHIECSAMAMTHLGETIDLHVGGRDLVFPHHENEVAQSEAATGQPFARYWLHCSLFEFDEEKMSSSLGNFVTVADAVAEHGPNAVRMFLVSGTYNATQTYSDAAVREAVERWERLSRAHEAAVEAADSPDARTKVEAGALRGAVETARTSFESAMNDDFNTREALAALFDLAGAVNRHVDADGPADYQGLRRAIETFERLGGDVLGFDFDGRGAGDVALADDLIELVLDLREAERSAGHFDRADALRERLESLGVVVEDTDAGPTYRH
jgi:cysteinyl-tRNA synthetase